MTWCSLIRDQMQSTCVNLHIKIGLKQNLKAKRACRLLVADDKP